jgi:hypothetical protein
MKRLIFQPRLDGFPFSLGLHVFLLDERKDPTNSKITVGNFLDLAKFVGKLVSLVPLLNLGKPFRIVQTRSN